MFRLNVQDYNDDV